MVGMPRIPVCVPATTKWTPKCAGRDFTHNSGAMLNQGMQHGISQIITY